MTRNEATLPPSQGNRLGCGRTRTSVQNLNRLVVARGKTLDQPQPAKGGEEGQKMKEFKNKEWLYQKYITEHLTIHQISEITNIPPRTIHSWLIKFEIPRRKGGANSPLTLSHKEKLRQTKLADKNPMWKGDKVGYIALHEWVRSRKPKPPLCEICGTYPPIDLANISGEYKRDLRDWQWLCRRCHMISDGRLDELRENQPKAVAARWSR